MRVVVLVDGEHYPPVVRAAIGRLRDRGDDVVGAVFVGGTEKIKEADLDAAFGVAVERGDDRESVLCRVLDEARPDAVYDLSDVPVVSPADRFRLAALTLIRGASYVGADFELRPPPMERVLSKATIRVFATDKRTGKTAVAGALARHAVARGRRPVIVAMGRGGPADPEVIEPAATLRADELVALADAGRHAASDYIEDAITSRVATIGCRRVGGGLAGGVFESNVSQGARIAEARDENLVILEGSGAALPPVHANAGVLCLSATTDPSTLTDHLGPYRLLLADVAVVTMAEDAALAARTEITIHRISPRTDIVRTVFRPKPLRGVSGRRIFFTTTAPPDVGPVLRRHLEDAHGCEVVGMSHALAQREHLRRDLEQAPYHDVLLTEIKAAAIDVAVRRARAAGTEVVFADNELIGDGVEEAFDGLLERAAQQD